MYKVSVPVINNKLKRMGREKILEEIQAMDGERVFLSVDAYMMSDEKREHEMAELRDNCRFFHEHGIEVGAWIWAFIVRGENSFTALKTLEGTECRPEVCPSDESFRRFAGGYISEIAGTGVDLIMFDDDLGYGFHGDGMCCTCGNHLKYMEDILGEKLDPAKLPGQILCGGRNRYRSAWMKSNGHFLKLFAREMRGAVDRVNPDIRLGNCARMSTWDPDGVDAETLSKILAGNTKPFLRLIGAPYWAVKQAWGNRVQDTVELERMERSWCGDGTEIFAEGDAWPRPRTNCPAGYIEIFDTALRADGGLDGILKYGIDYYSNAGYETGFSERHMENKPLYAEIEKSFGGKAACGVRIYECMTKFEDFKVSGRAAEKGSGEVQNVFFPVAARMAANSSIPTTYRGLGTGGIAFAENVTAVPEEAFKRGMIIDLRAAQILQERGIDTGLLSVGEEADTQEEYFEDTKEYTLLWCKAHRTEISEKARVSSRFILSDESRIVGSYTYENDKGYKFFVFTFDAYFGGETMYRSYARSLQLKNAIGSFGCGRLPAYSYGNPDLYIMAKRNENGMAVGLWNAFADYISEPAVELDREYKRIHFINCDGRLEGNRVYLSKMQPFAFAGFTVE